MKKLISLLLILTISTGCFFNQKKLNCSGNIDLGNTKINNEYQKSTHRIVGGFFV